LMLPLSSGQYNIFRFAKGCTNTWEFTVYYHLFPRYCHIVRNTTRTSVDFFHAQSKLFIRRE